jgi:hypothetical protein
MLTGQLITRWCEHCHRPNVGADRCPHAIDPRYQCPYDRERKRRRDRFRHIGI